MASATITLNVSMENELLACLTGMEERMNEAMRETACDGGDVIYDLAFAYINKRTGRTAGTIGEECIPHATGGTAYVGSSDRIARFLEFGTSPHQIRAAPGGALFFEGTFASVVNHPGTPEYAWLLRAGQDSVGPIISIAMGHVEAALAC